MWIEHACAVSGYYHNIYDQLFLPNYHINTFFAQNVAENYQPLEVKFNQTGLQNHSNEVMLIPSSLKAKIRSGFITLRYRARCNVTAQASAKGGWKHIGKPLMQSKNCHSQFVIMLHSPSYRMVMEGECHGSIGSNCKH